MKWGIVDNYARPKRSFEYVKTGYQPVLVNLEFDKRRWSNTENFNDKIWIVNDFYREYKNCEITYSILNDDRNVLESSTFKVDNIEENSSKEFVEIDKSILKKVKKNFYVHLELKNNQKEIIFSNDYIFLIGNQEDASEKFKAMGKK